MQSKICVHYFEQNKCGRNRFQSTLDRIELKQFYEQIYTVLNFFTFEIFSDKFKFNINN